MDLGPLVPIVAIVSSLGWGWLSLQKKRLAHEATSSSDEARDLRAENAKLSERLAVLERIATDMPSALTREIEELR